MVKKILGRAVVGVIILLTISSALANCSYEIKASVICTGGSPDKSGGGYTLKDSFGQPPGVTTLSGGDYELKGGFLSSLGEEAVAADVGIDHHRSWYNCAIATAAYGTPLAEEVKVLFTFRDQYLLTNTPGKALVRFYYCHSPEVADFIRNKEPWKAVVRAGLRPLLWLARKSIKN